MTDFQKWERFNVESEEKAIDLQEKNEENISKKAEKIAETRTLESEGINIAEDLAAKATAHARVAALRAKGNSRRRNKGNSSTHPTHTLNDPIVTELDAQADFLRNLSSELKTLIQQRDKAVKLLKNGEFTEGFKNFQLTLEGVAAAECKLPNIDDDDEAEDRNSVDGTDTTGQAIESMRRTIHMVRVDTLRGLGQCQLSRGLLAEASDVFKASLLADGEDIASWLGRGECFLTMGLATLAELHFVQAQSIIEKPDQSKIKQSKLDVVSIGRVDIDGSLRGLLENLRSREVPAVVEVLPLTVKACLHRANAYSNEGAVCFKERFFWTAGLKFSGALDCLNEAHTLSQPKAADATPPSNNNIGESKLFRELRCSCHLNLAACSLQRARDYQSAVHHTFQVLDILDGEQESATEFHQFRLKALLRRAEAYAKLGKFDKGITDLRNALQACHRFSAEGECIFDIEKRLERILYKKTQFASVTNEDGGK